MADTEFAHLTFSLPEDTGTDRILVFTSATEGGVYTADTPAYLDYQYGETTVELADIDITKWYKIQFYNSVDDKLGALSQAANGADWTTDTAPELFVGTTHDGAQYATIADVRGYVFEALDGIATVTDARVFDSLKRARGIIDLQTGDMSLARFTATYETSIARRKYNATLQVLKTAEINFSLGMIYAGLAQDVTLGLISRTITIEDDATETTAEDITETTEEDITDTEDTDQTVTVAQTVTTAVDDESTGDGDWGSISIGQTAISQGAWTHALGAKGGTVTTAGTEVTERDRTDIRDRDQTVITDRDQTVISEYDKIVLDEAGLITALEAMATSFMQVGEDLLTSLHSATVNVTLGGGGFWMTPLQRVKAQGA